MCEKSPETRAKISDAMKRSWRDPQVRQRRREAANKRRVDRALEQAGLRRV